MGSYQPKLTHEQRRERRSEIADLVAQGCTVEKAAQEFEVAMSTVLNACREHGVAPRWEPKLTTMTMRKGTLEVLAALQNTDDTLVEIAKRYGVSKQRIHQILARARAAGLRFPGRRQRDWGPGKRRR